MASDVGVSTPIALPINEIGDSGSSGESDEENLIVADKELVSGLSTEPPKSSQNDNITKEEPLIETQPPPEKPAAPTVKVKEVEAPAEEDEDKPMEKEQAQAKIVEGPKVEPTMLEVLQVPDPEQVERDGHVPTIYDIDIDQLEEKPWRSTDADITDWFNYGFTEDTWREYCTAQVRARSHLLGKSNSKPKPQAVAKPNPTEAKINLKPPIISHRGPPSRQSRHGYMKLKQHQPPRQRQHQPPRQPQNFRMPNGPRMPLPPMGIPNRGIPNRILPNRAPVQQAPMMNRQAPMMSRQAPMMSRQAPMNPPPMSSLPNLQNLLAAGSNKPADLSALLPNFASLPGMPMLTPNLRKLLTKTQNKKRSRSRSRRRRKRRRDDSRDRDYGRRRRRRHSNSPTRGEKRT